MQIVERKVTYEYVPPNEEEIEKQQEIFSVGQVEPIGFFGVPIRSVSSNLIDSNFLGTNYMSSATTSFYETNPVIKIEEIKCITEDGRQLVYEEHLHKNNEKRYRVHSADYTEDEFIKYFVDMNFSADEIIGLWNIEQKSSIIKQFGFEKIFTDDNIKLIDSMTDESVVTNQPIKYDLFDVVVSKNPDIIGRIVRVEDCSTHKFAYLSIPRNKDTDTCKKAVAWTFGMKPNEYRPEYET